VAFISFMIDFVDDLSLVLNVKVLGVYFVDFSKVQLICIARCRRIVQ
jgi:hypothetical protein